MAKLGNRLRAHPENLLKSYENLENLVANEHKTAPHVKDFMHDDNIQNRDVFNILCPIAGICHQNTFSQRFQENQSVSTLNSQHILLRRPMWFRFAEIVSS